jgi:hypothetical protein
VKTPWVEYPDLYSASCQSAGGATWLQVDDVGTASDPRPRITETLGPTWGFHLYDVNLALGNLVGDVRAQEQASQAASRRVGPGRLGLDGVGRMGGVVAIPSSRSNRADVILAVVDEGAAHLTDLVEPAGRVPTDVLGRPALSS